MNRAKRSVGDPLRRSRAIAVVLLERFDGRTLRRWILGCGDDALSCVRDDSAASDSSGWKHVENQMVVPTLRCRARWGRDTEEADDEVHGDHLRE
jgi:hypothetical protein